LTDRAVKVSLSLQVSNYLANMEAARKTTTKTTDSLEAQKAASIALAKAQGEASSEIGRGVMLMGAAVAVGVGVAVAKYAEFDQSMSNVKAATQETTENMGLLRAAALDAGAETVYSATEAAGAVEELGKNGLTTAQILKGGLGGALSLAAAGQLEVARAAEVAAVSMKQFGLTGDKIPHIADLLAAGAGKAAGDVEDMAQALSQAGLVAHQYGLSIEDTTGVLAAFADQGLKGSDGGTAMKSMMQALVPTSKAASETMKEMGISAYDAGGQFVGIANFAGQYRDAMLKLTPELQATNSKIIFGSDAVRASNVLFQLGADGVKKYIDQTNDSGYAAKVAADRLNNLAGDVEYLGGAFDTYLIKSGSGANDVLRTLTQAATGLVDAVGSVPEPVLGAGLAVGGLVAAVALAGGAALVAVPKVAALKTSLTTLGISGGTAARGVGMLSGGLAVAGAAFGLYAAYQAQATAGAQEFKDSLDPATGAVTNYTREIVAKKLAESGAFDSAKAAGISQKELTNAVLEGGKALEKVKNTLSGRNNAISFFDFSEEGGIAAGNAQTTIRELSENLVKGKENLSNQAAAADGSAESTEAAATTYKSAADTATEFADNLTTLIDTLNKANGVGQDAVSTNAAYQSALDAARTTVQEYTDAHGVSIEALNESTVAGSENAAMLAELAGSSQTAAKAALDAGGSAEEYKASLESGRQAIYDTALALTGNADAAQALTDKIYAMPDEKQIAIVAETTAAAAALQTFLDELNNIPGRKAVVVDYVIQQTGAAPGAVKAAYDRASGGILPGAPSSTDNLLIHAATGEFVTNAASTAIPSNRAALEFMNRGGTIRGYAGGGQVGYPTRPQYVQSGHTYGGNSSSVTNTPTLNQTNHFGTVPDPGAAADLAAVRAANKLRRLV
jgi:TP901 family phage tail tape measure protein